MEIEDAAGRTGTLLCSRWRSGRPCTNPGHPRGAVSLSFLSDELRVRPTRLTAPAAWSCAGHAQQLGGESLLLNLMEVKG